LSERFLIEPGIPQSKVKTVFAQCDDKALRFVFDNLSIKVIEPMVNRKLETPIGLHADVLINNTSNSEFFIDKNQKVLIDFLYKNGAKVNIIENIKSPYPQDCLLNFVNIGDFIICNKKIIPDTILEKISNKCIIDVNQGYSKCSVCVVKKNVIITDDIAIHSKVSKYSEISSLYVEKGSVNIEKYNYGFIGGCCGLIDKDLLLFNGDLSLHINHKDILKFLEKNNVKYVDIKGKPLNDIGSIIPITEEDDAK